MRNFYHSTTAKLAVMSLMLLPASASAQTIQEGLGGAKANIGASGIGKNVDVSDADLTTLIGRMINIFLGVLGIIFVLLVIYAGWLRIASQGDAGKVEKSNKLLVQAVIGIVIIVAAYAIANFVLQGIIQSTTI